MRVKDIMTTPVVTIARAAPLSDAVSLLTRHKLSGIAVVDAHGALCGILSEGDLLRRIEIGTARTETHWWAPLFSTDGLAEAYKKTNGRRVEDVMTNAPVTIAPGDTLAEAALRMQKHRVKRLPVVEGGTLVGIVSRSDFVKVLEPFVAAPYQEQATSDREIRDRVATEIAHQKWSMDCRIEVEVREGHVTLTGYVPSEEHRSAARVAAENVTGVTSVDQQIAVNPALAVYAM